MTPEGKLTAITHKIGTLEKSIDDHNGYGATVTIAIGIYTSVVLWGIPILIGGLVWAWINRCARDRAREEIVDLEAELYEV